MVANPGAVKILGHRPSTEIQRGASVW